MGIEEDRERWRLEAESERTREEMQRFAELTMLTLMVQCMLLAHPKPEVVRILWNERMAVLWASIGATGRPDENGKVWREIQERWEQLLPK